MINFSTMTVPTLLSGMRDIILIVSTLGIGWKIRAWVQPGIDFFIGIKEHLVKSSRHMETMEYQMNLLLTNHLAHIEADLKSLSDRALNSKEV
jgi:hypothetical protein